MTFQNLSKPDLYQENLIGDIPRYAGDLPTSSEGYHVHLDLDQHLAKMESCCRIGCLELATGWKPYDQVLKDFVSPTANMATLSSASLAAP